MANTIHSDALTELRAGLLTTYERACGAGTRASTAWQWRALANSLSDAAAKTMCRATAQRLFDRADDCMARAQRMDSLEAMAVAS